MTFADPRTREQRTADTLATEADSVTARNITRQRCARPNPDARRQMDYLIRQAGPADAAAVTGLVDAAYGHYVQRIGMKPGPMTRDYDEVIRDHDVTVAERDGAVVAVIVLQVTDEGFLVDNVAVHPSCQGEGLGRALLSLAEPRARDAGFASIYLYTHEKMTENQALYARMGYVEYRRLVENGFARVFMRKHLG